MVLEKEQTTTHPAFFITKLVAQRNQTGFEFVGFETTSVIPIKMVETSSQVLHLLSRQSFGITGQNLVLNFIYRMM